MLARELGKRAVLLLVTAAVVVGAAGVAPQVLDTGGEGGGSESMATPEYDPAALATTPSPARGVIRPAADPTSGVVVVDTRHANGVDREDIAPVVDALVRKGLRVEFADDNSDLAAQLNGARAFVVVDPGREFPRQDVRAVKRFTDDGGHLLVAGEPTRKEIASSGGLVSRDESELTSLLSAYQVSLDTRYLYNLETNDGNFKHVVASPTQAARMPDVERVTLYTAAAVTSRSGRAVLQAAPGTRRSDDDGQGRYTVAVRQENVLVLGDATLMRQGRYNVGDNERFLGHVVSFLIEGERANLA
jgi:hypothetical protein